MMHTFVTVADKVSAHLACHEKLLLDTARPIRWDSDHGVVLAAAINRIAAYVTGTRATRQAILCRLLNPSTVGKGHEGLALLELTRQLPWGAVWDDLCRREDVPAGADWLEDVSRYEKTILSKCS